MPDPTYLPPSDHGIAGHRPLENNGPMWWPRPSTSEETISRRVFHPAEDGWCVILKDGSWTEFRDCVFEADPPPRPFLGLLIAVPVGLFLWTLLIGLVVWTVR